MSKVFEHWWKILKLEPMLNQNLKQLKLFSTVIEHKRPQQFGSSNVYDWLNLHLICRALIRSIFSMFLFSAVFIRIPGQCTLFHFLWDQFGGYQWKKWCMMTFQCFLSVCMIFVFCKCSNAGISFWFLSNPPSFPL